MRIREEQLAALTGNQMEGFVLRMLEHLRTLYPEHFYTRSETELRRLIESAVARAGFFGLNDEFAVARFLDYCVLLGPEFERQPEQDWMLRILSDEERSQLHKIRDIDRIQFGGAIEEPPFDGD